MAIKSVEREEGCFAHAAEDEPLFVLRANDELAPALVREWARAYQHKHMSHGYGREPIWDTPKAKEKYESAWRLATAMEQFKQAQRAAGGVEQ